MPISGQPLSPVHGRRSLERACADLRMQLTSHRPDSSQEPEATAGIARLQSSLAKAQQALEVRTAWLLLSGFIVQS